MQKNKDGKPARSKLKNTVFSENQKRTFIITYNPLKWPESEIQKLINRLNDASEVIGRWTFGSPKKCKIGDRVFLSRVGPKKPGMIGSGHIASDPRLEPNFQKPEKPSWYVDIRFDFLSPTPDTVIITHKELSSLLKVGPKAFTPIQSGVPFKGDQAQLEKIWKSLTGVKDIDIIKDLEEIRTDQELNDTEKEQLTKCRIGQGKFRDELRKYWGDTCAITGCDEVSILVASHIKPWKYSKNKERLDSFNGFLLSPNFDRLFDKGLISFNNKGKIMISDKIGINNVEKLGLSTKLYISLRPEHKKYLKFHRDRIFLG